jgi:hypothetical protein
MRRRRRSGRRGPRRRGSGGPSWRDHRGGRLRRSGTGWRGRQRRRCGRRGNCGASRRRVVRADRRQNGTAGERRTNWSGDVNGWFFGFGRRRFFALGRAFGMWRRRRFDVRRSPDNRGGFGLAVRLSSGRDSRGRCFLATDFAPGIVTFCRPRNMFPRGVVVFHFRDGGGRGGPATFGCGSCRLGGFAAIMAAKLDRRVFVDGAGVRLFFGDAEFREQVQYFVGLDFQLPRQLVNSDLSHR